MKKHVLAILFVCVVLVCCQTTSETTSSSSNNGGTGRTSTSSTSTTKSTSKVTKGGTTIEKEEKSTTDGKDGKKEEKDVKDAKVSDEKIIAAGYDDGKYYKGDDGHYLNGKFHNDEMAKKPIFEPVYHRDDYGRQAPSFPKKNFGRISNDWRRDDLHGNFGNVGFYDDVFTRNEFFDE